MKSFLVYSRTCWLSQWTASWCTLGLVGCRNEQLPGVLYDLLAVTMNSFLEYSMTCWLSQWTASWSTLWPVGCHNEELPGVLYDLLAVTMNSFLVYSMTCWLSQWTASWCTRQTRSWTSCNSFPPSRPGPFFLNQDKRKLYCQKEERIGTFFNLHNNMCNFLAKNMMAKTCRAISVADHGPVES